MAEGTLRYLDFLIALRKRALCCCHLSRVQTVMGLPNRWSDRKSQKSTPTRYEREPNWKKRIHWRKSATVSGKARSYVFPSDISARSLDSDGFRPARDCLHFLDASGPCGGRNQRHGGGRHMGDAGGVQGRQGG